jgi:hypothetical protein
LDVEVAAALDAAKRVRAEESSEGVAADSGTSSGSSTDSELASDEDDPMALDVDVDIRLLATSEGRKAARAERAARRANAASGSGQAGKPSSKRGSKQPAAVGL